MRSKLPFIVAAVLLYALAWALYFPVAPGFAFTYDESDYMWAGRQGFWANYTDQHGLSFFEFVRKGLELSKDPDKRGSFSQFIRSTGDIGMYRHYHGPMFAYWLAFLHNIGITHEDVFRGCGLLIHFATATVILFGIWAVFPGLPVWVALLGCALFIFDRTALVAATTVITQHVLFTLLCVSTLFAAGLFFTRLEKRWFFAVMVLLAAAFATVETSALLVLALFAALVLQYGRIRERWPLWKSQFALLGQGIGVFVLALLLFWPKGVLQLAIAKGFLTLAYISIYRKTFTPFGPTDLWSAKFLASPWEFTLVVSGSVAAFLLWRKSAYRAQLLPWLAFIATFLLVTLKVTVEYTYYHAPVVAAMTVATAIACGLLWMKWGAPWRWAVLAMALICMGATGAGFLTLSREVRATHPFHSVAVEYVRAHPVPPGRVLYLPYQMVPTLHYYAPELMTSGYDVNYPAEQVAAGVVSAAAADVFLCEEPLCRNILQHVSARSTAEPIGGVGPNGAPLLAVHLDRNQEGK